MSQATVHAVFSTHAEAAAAIAALSKAGLAPGSLSVIGVDSDAFRQATASLTSHYFDKYLLKLGLLGAAAGALAGFLGQPHIASYGNAYLMFVPVYATFAGAAIGCFTGMAVGAVTNIDRLPYSEATIKLGKVNNGEMAVSVKTQDSAERAVAQRLFEESGASHISFDVGNKLVEQKRDGQPVATLTHA